MLHDYIRFHNYDMDYDWNMKFVPSYPAYRNLEKGVYKSKKHGKLVTVNNKRKR